MTFIVQSHTHIRKAPTERIHKNKVPWYGLPRTRCDQDTLVEPSQLDSLQGSSQSETST